MTEIHFINVGYGDAALIVERAAGKPVFSMLIDCGGDTVGDDDPTGSRIAAADYLKLLGLESIDILLLSHLHLDHAGGLPAIAGNCAVKELWTPYVPRKSAWGKEIRIRGSLAPAAANLSKSLNLYATALEILDTGHTVFRLIANGFNQELPCGSVRVTAGEQSLIQRQTEILDTVFADEGTDGLLGELHAFINDTSLRAKLNLQGFVFLFTGDIDDAAWEKERIPKADVVKLPHHGQPGSINREIIRALSAKYGVISVSNTRRDCPDPGVIAWLERSGSRVLITDVVGGAGGQESKKQRAVRFQIDGGALTLCGDE